MMTPIVNRERSVAGARDMQKTVGSPKIPDRNAAQYREHAAQTPKRPDLYRKSHFSPTPSWMPAGKNFETAQPGFWLYGLPVGPKTAAYITRIEEKPEV